MHHYRKLPRLVPRNALVLTGMVTLLESNSEVILDQFRQKLDRCREIRFALAISNWR
jgi:hypothetical protein